MNENPNNNQNFGDNTLNSNTLGEINPGNVTPNNNIDSLTMNNTQTILNSINQEVPNNTGYGATPNTVNPINQNNLFTPPVNNEMELLTDMPSPTPNNNEEVLTEIPVTSSEPVPQPIPIPDNNQVNPMMANANTYINTKSQDIGVVPPANTNKNNKKASNKIVFIILIVILMCAIAFGIYYFLNKTNKKVTLTPKTVSVSIGERISTKVSDFVTIKKGDISLCSVSHNADSSKIGEYIYTVTCGEKQKYSGKIIVSDKTAPDVELNVVFKTVGDTVTVDDFIYSCTDLSECSKKFVNASDVNQNLTKAQNTPYTVDIEVSDSVGNKKTVNGILYVVDRKIIAYLVFESKEEQLSDYQATRKVNDIFPIGVGTESSVESLGVSRRNYIYVFSNKEDYLKVAGNKETILTFDEKTGNAVYDDANQKIIISTDLSKKTLDEEINGVFPTSFTELKAYYDTKGYKSSNTMYYMQKK